MDNVTEYFSSISDTKFIYARSNLARQYFPMTDILLIIISIVGIFANSVAMFILNSSRRINASPSYMLLMNQSAVDATASIAMFCFIFTRNFLHRRYLNGILDQLYCHVVFSGTLTTGANCVSSINLSVLSLERMVCIVFPIQHRTKCTRRIVKRLAALTWVIGASAITPLSIIANGINEKLGGQCYFWNRLNSDVSSKLFTFTFAMITFGFPFMVMLFSYACIYLKLRNRAVKESVKLNVVKVLSTCVFMFLVCNSAKACFNVITRFSSYNLIGHGVFKYAILMMMSNSLVNPFIYSFQYSDYRRELKRQLYKFTSNKKKLYNIESSSHRTNDISIVSLNS